MELFSTLLMDATRTARGILFEVLPIAVIIFGSQLLVIRTRVANQHKIAIGFVYVVIGLTLFWSAWTKPFSQLEKPWPPS